MPLTRTGVYLKLVQDVRKDNYSSGTALVPLEDYFNYNDDTDSRYELEDGELLCMSPESDLNLRIVTKKAGGRGQEAGGKKYSSKTLVLGIKPSLKKELYRDAQREIQSVQDPIPRFKTWVPPASCLLSPAS